MAESAKKVTVNIPVDLLNNARKLTGSGITDTILEGLREIEKRHKRNSLIRLRGKVKFDLDLEKTRK